MLPPWFWTAASFVAVAGPVSHAGIWIQGEWDGIVHQVASWICSSQAAGLLLLRWSGEPLLHSIWVLLLLDAIYGGCLAFSIAIYRLFLHPTRCFPGPFWARLSSWWRVKTFIDHQEQAFAVTHELHQQYGDIVRAGPRFVSINHVDAVAALYGSTSQCIKSANYTLLLNDHLQTLRDPAKHRHRRTMWDRGLNAKACQTYLPRLHRLSSLFVERIAEYGGKPISINDWCHYVTFDVMGEIGFGKSYGQLETGNMHPSIEAISKFLKFSISAWQVPWAANMFVGIPGLPDPAWAMKHHAEICVMDRKKEEPLVPDVMSYVFSGYEFQSEWLVDDNTMIDDAFMLQTAGSDTSYSALVYSLYYLAKHPRMQEVLREELKEVSSAEVPDWTKLSTLPLLDAVINETLRLHPPVMSGMPRETPNHGAQIGPYWVPGETIVAVPTYTIQRDERYFVRPDEWIPERWIDQQGLILDRHAWIPFSVGPYNCAGKYFAMMEMKVLIAKTVAAFDIEMAPGEDGKNLVEGCKDFMTTWLPPLKMCLKPRMQS